MFKNSYKSESHGRYRVVHATKWSKGGGIEKKLRLIVIMFPSVKEEDGGKYAIRWQDRDGNTFGGGAFNSLESAHNTFLRRYLDHNAAYRKGNPSHLPGLTKG